jgi:hypothetical protein
LALGKEEPGKPGYTNQSTHMADEIDASADGNEDVHGPQNDDGHCVPPPVAPGKSGKGKRF